LVTVADDWTIADHEWRHIDVVRWAVLVIDVSTAELPQDILNLIRDALREAVAAADSRLLVVRLQLQGSTRWHGDFLKRGEAWEAECQGLIQDLGADRIWLEKLQIATQPRYNIEELIQQDPLVKRVWESLTAWGSTMEHFPAAAQELLKTLPADLQDQVRQEWQGDGGARWRADIQGLILEVLGRQGSS
jgi:cyanate lyase